MLVAVNLAERGKKNKFRNNILFLNETHTCAWLSSIVCASEACLPGRKTYSTEIVGRNGPQEIAWRSSSLPRRGTKLRPHVRAYTTYNVRTHFPLAEPRQNRDGGDNYKPRRDETRRGRTRPGTKGSPMFLFYPRGELSFGSPRRDASLANTT